MKLKLSLFLLVCFMSFGILKSFILIHYYINFNYYATELCENKDKPQMHCNGKCKLKKELSQIRNSNEKENKDLVLDIYKFQFPPFILSIEKQILASNDFLILNSKKIQNNILNTLQGYNRKVFKPPTFV